MLFCGFAAFCGLHPNGDFPLHPWLEFFIASAIGWVVLVRWAARKRPQARGFPVIIQEQNPKNNSDYKATLELLERWEAQNATSDPQEIAQREKEGEEFMRSLARSRLEMEGPNARKLWP